MAEYRAPVNPPSILVLTFESNRLIGFNLENLRGRLCSLLFSLARKEGILVVGPRPAVLSPFCMQRGRAGKSLFPRGYPAKGSSVWGVSKPLCHGGSYQNVLLLVSVSLSGRHGQFTQPGIWCVVCTLWFGAHAAFVASPWCLGTWDCKTTILLTGWFDFLFSFFLLNAKNSGLFFSKKGGSRWWCRTASSCVAKVKTQIEF